MNSPALVQRHEHSTMQRKRHIHAKEIIPDILRGMTDAELMQKYKLSPSTFRFISPISLKSKGPFGMSRKRPSLSQIWIARWGTSDLSPSRVDNTSTRTRLPSRQNASGRL